MFLGAQKPALPIDVLVEAGKLSVNFCLNIFKGEQTWPEGWVLTNSGLTSQKYVPILWVLSCGTDPIKAQIKSLPAFHPQHPRTQTDFNFQPALKLQHPKTWASEGADSSRLPTFKELWWNLILTPPP